eukprot:TRINITY_DN3891_c0_g1_i2.p1 TRINITY_DN3891_c0_g1~~TRINITY_DN3891_c0_g1_i2.p1  ORF type:complete len:695 (-),score=114.95 TRINITY_DN3891_c0_g1_i2:86-2170(-)
MMSDKLPPDAKEDKNASEKVVEPQARSHAKSVGNSGDYPGTPTTNHNHNTSGDKKPGSRGPLHTVVPTNKNEVPEELRKKFDQSIHKGDVKEVHSTLKAIKKSMGLRSKGTGRLLLTQLKDEENMCALHVAVDCNHKELVQFLVSKCPELVNECGNKTECTPLVLAATKGDLEMCKLLLTVKKIDVNLVNIDFTSALHYVVRAPTSSGQQRMLLSELVCMLLKKRAQLNGQTRLGETPVHQAARVGHQEAIRILAEGGADINKQNGTGQTPLHYAVLLGHTFAVEMLLTHHAQKDIKTIEGLTALDIARKENRQEIADMIMYWNDNAQIRTEEKQRLILLRKYEKMVLVLNDTHFFAKALSIYTDKADYDRLAKALIHISIPTGTTIQLIRSLIQVEFEHNKHSSSVLRGNCPASKVMGAFSRQIGQQYLQRCVGDVVCNLVLDESISFELDENKMRDVENIEERLAKNKDALLEHATNVLQKIISENATKAMPREIRAVAGFIAEYARKYCADKETSLTGGFLMLRFINPALVAPESYEMLPLGKSPTMQGRRNLILLTKLLQNLSNDVEFGVKEPHMAVVNEFIVSNREAMSNFLRNIASDPLAVDDQEEWLDCKLLNLKPLVDIKMLDLKELNFLHRLLIQYRGDLQRQLEEDKRSGAIPLEEYSHALSLFKILDNLAGIKEIALMLQQQQ